jgi:hypothetical protein
VPPPILWAQAAPIAPGADPATAGRIADIALRRWFSGLTLSPNEPAPDQVAWLAWAAGLAALVVLATALQGPGRMLVQLLDVPGHARVVLASLGRFRRAGRLVAALCGALVLSWTTWQAVRHADPRRLEDLLILVKAHPPAELAAEQAWRAALTTFRDLAGLADISVLLLVAGIVLFRLSADRWGALDTRDATPRAPIPAATVPAWGAAWLYLLYRAASIAFVPDGLPLGRILGVDLVLVPTLALACDGLLLAWVLGELRRAFSDAPPAPLPASAAAALAGWPAATLACLAVLPARYVGLVAWLALPYVPAGGPPHLTAALRAVLRGDAPVWLQAASLPLAPLLGAAAWARVDGRPGPLRLAADLIRAEGGRLVAVVAGGTVASAGLSALAYLALLSLPPQPWVLAAADAYAHFATLPAALLLLATLVELAGRRPRPADPAPAAEEAAAVA